MRTTRHAVAIGLGIVTGLGAGLAAIGGGCKQVIGWQAATLLDGGMIGACTPGTTTPCYTGPTGEERFGVGTCNAGTAKCNEDGTGYGACEGEVDQPKGAACALGDGAVGVCNGTGACVECNAAKDCTSGKCTDGACCVPTTCAALGKTCGTASDGCVGTLDCDDHVKDGAETDVDCGGSRCPACADGKICGADTDCAGGTCNSGMCCTHKTCSDLGLTCGTAFDTCGAMLDCNDGVKDGTETDVDCGGSGDPDAGVPPCPPCALGDACVLNADCSSMVCSNETCCNTTCALCNRCTPAGFADAGSCMPVAKNANDGPCNPTNLQTCDGQGHCLGLHGYHCTANGDCLSNLCNKTPPAVMGTCQ
jgi:hypothetical protein